MSIGTRIPDRPGEEPDHGHGTMYSVMEGSMVSVLKRTYSAPDPRPGESEITIYNMLTAATPFIDMSNISHDENNFSMFTNTSSTAGMDQVDYIDTANTGIDYYMIVTMVSAQRSTYQIFIDRDGDGLIDGAVSLQNPADEMHLDFTGDGRADQILTFVY